MVWACGGRWVGTDVPTMGSNALSRASAFGQAVGAVDNSVNSASFPNNPRFMPSASDGGFTVAVTGYIPTPGGTRYIVSYENSGGPGGWGIYATATAVSAYAVQLSPTTYKDIVGVGGIGGLGTHGVFAFTFSPIFSTLEGWRGGRLISNVGMSSMVTAQIANPLRIHANPSNTASASAADLSCVAIWQRALLQAEHAMLAADPFCMLRF